MTDSDRFDLYDYLKKDYNYEQILLKKEEGLILFSWYQEAPTQALSENDIYAIIKKVKNQLGASIETSQEAGREERIQYFQILKKLKIHFIKSNQSTDKQLYKLTEFALHFCKIIAEQLSIQFQPSDVELSIKDLRQLLVTKIEKLEELEHWHRKYFEENKRPLEGQIEKLGREIHKTILELNNIIKHKSLEFEQKIENCNHKLMLVSEQAKKLNRAFLELDEIGTFLKNYEVGFDTETLLNIRQDVLYFIESCRLELSGLQTTLQKVKGDVYKFAQDVHKKLYDAQLDQFLDYVFAHSNLQIKGITNKDLLNFEIVLPERLQTVTSLMTSLDKFTRIKYKVFDKTPPPVIDRVETTSEASQLALKKQEADSKSKTRIKVTVNEWFEVIKKDLIAKKNIHFTPYFYRILEASGGELESAIKVAGMVVKKFSKNKLIQIEIKTELDSNPNSPTLTSENIQIWQMNLIYNPVS